MRDLVRFRFPTTSSIKALGFITAPDYIPNVLIIDSTIEDNLFFEANFVSLNMSQTAYRSAT